jgi:indole-3-glycerol phosphate synthase
MWAYRTIAELNVSRTGTEAQEISDGTWVPPKGTLGELVRAKLARRESPVTRFTGTVPPFGEAICRDFISVIAEIKRASPTRGPIRPELDAASQAAAFARGGARAISVLTEPDRFGGSIEDIARVRAAASLPILKKDFHTTPEHLLEAKALGASAALLIVRALAPTALQECMTTAREIGLEVLVEVHRPSELDLAVKCGAQIIGVNSRNLETLELDPGVHGRLLPRIPEEVIAVAESGMSVRLDLRRVADQGADAVLIGTSLSQATDVVALLRSLSSVTRRPHADSN